MDEQAVVPVSLQENADLMVKECEALPQAENTLAALSEEEKSLRINEIQKELSAYQTKQIELYKKLDEIEGRRTENTPLNAEEKALVAHWRESQKKNKSPYCFEAYRKNGDRFDLACAGVFKATGSSDLHFGLRVLSRCAQASCLGPNNEDPRTFEKHYNGVVNAINELKPEDEVEGMLVSRLIALHAQGIYYLACAANNATPPMAVDTCINRSTKLFRLYNETLETLTRYRRRGEQKVTVTHQHVSVGDGGKAVVTGSMVAGGGGGQ